MSALTIPHKFLIPFSYTSQIEELPVSPDLIDAEDIDIVDATAVSNPLHLAWKQGEKFGWSAKKVVVLTGVYLLGSIGYVLALPFRIVRACFQILYLALKILFFPLCVSSASIKFTAWKTLRLTLEILVCPVGILCPPLGYFMDRQVDRLADSEDRKDYMYVVREPIQCALAIHQFGPNQRPTKQDIEKKYKELALTCHPDKVGENDKKIAESKFVVLNNAKETLEKHYLPKIKG